ncbi:MAG: hypothetical protein K1X68_00360 [Saprospiraceae bacterium]|nr:hypothetical protein [Saprospiraceae bacterium]HMW38610.1 hypothetical protein [Saprospiraceae bacterium]HMX88508.1 hypothetical protein [Saprospiraceae bacterium]HMZ40526.1 hypothetical protein [Saprospiraceae bacterium]HNA65525.1 hypothetical protein [Saprospiraceae bacterium]
MNKLYLLLILLISQSIYAQNDKAVTNEFIITGKVKTERTVTLSDLRHFPAISINDINTSCTPKKEERTKSVKAVLLKNVLDSVRFDYVEKRDLGHYYFLFVSADDYKIVFSFNEIYNTEIGNNLYIVTELDGKKIEDLDSRVLVLSTKDIRGGSRNIKGLSKIVVCKAE